ncbi:MAG TPA: acetylxylan esterase [Terracidiphilus sp.]|nr:acetylxylan esterase [Terracidiphilus sp.]
MTPLFQGFRGLASIAAAGLLLWTGSIRVAAQRAPAASAEKHAQTAGQPNSSSGEPVHLSSEQERERELRLLGIRDVEMRPRSSPDARAPNAANYDEAKADVYPTLPDPLVLHDGQRVTSAAMWWKKRRPEIVAEFDREILGYMPKHLPGVRWTVVKSTPERADGLDVITKYVVGHVDNSIDPKISVDIDLLLVTPAHAARPVPVMMELALGSEFKTALAGPAAGAPDKWAVPWQPALRRGWGFAELSATSVQADSGAGLTEGIIGLMNRGQPRSLEDWGVLKAWAWGASRALDYFETDKAVNAKEVGVEGHSRLGKAALVAMAYDPRFAIVYSSSSGEGGAKLYRHIFGEPLTSLTSVSLYQWFDGNFLRYGGPKNAGDLPVDAHELIALCAPRPVFIGGGADVGDGYANPKGDAWADTKGMFLAEVAAGPVYRLLGAKGLGTTVYPVAETTLIGGDLGFRQQPYGHTPQPNWPYFLEFASHYFGAGR